MSTSELEWGETPFDGMSHDELFETCLRLYMACIEAKGALKMVRHGDPASPYWGGEGTGGIALSMLEQATAKAKGEHDSDNMYGCLFRYIDCLLFDGPGITKWRVCEKDGMIQGSYNAGTAGSPCITCGGPMRPLSWDDMNPREKIDEP